MKKLIFYIVISLFVIDFALISQNQFSIIADEAFLNGFDPIDLELNYSIRPLTEQSIDIELKVWTLPDNMMSEEHVINYQNIFNDLIIHKIDENDWVRRGVIQLMKDHEKKNIVIPNSFLLSDLMKRLEDCPDCFEIDLPPISGNPDDPNIPENCFTIRKEPCYAWENSCFEIICVD